jgi:hypothetical protein
MGHAKLDEIRLISRWIEVSYDAFVLSMPDLR